MIPGSVIPIPISIPQGLIPILIPIPRFSKIHDSDSSSKRFRFWFRFQCFPKFRFWFRFQYHVILIPVFYNFNDSNSDSSYVDFDSNPDSSDIDCESRVSYLVSLILAVLNMLMI